MVEGQDKVIRFGTELVNGIQRRASQSVYGPLFKISQQAQERLAVLCMVDVPDLLLNVGIERPESSPGTVSDLEKGVEEALHHDDGRKERLPSLLGWQPTIGVDGLRSIVWVHVLGFVFEVAIGCGQCAFVSRERQRRTQDTVCAYAGGDVSLFAVEMDMLFVGE